MGTLLSQEDFLNKALVNNGLNIDLSNAVFINTRTKVNISCKVCGQVWDILPKVLFTKEVKCPSCSGRDRINSNFTNNPMTLYFIRIRTDMKDEPEYIYKVGITKYNVVSRFNPDDLRRIDILKEIRFNDGETAYNTEQKIADVMKDLKYYGKFKLGSHGNTELYTANPLDFIFSRNSNGNN